MKSYLIAYKTFFALLGFSALVTEIAVLVDRDIFNPNNFFSYFTIESNIIVVVTLLLSALYTANGTNIKLDALRGAATLYILIVGVGFSVLLSGLENTVFTIVPWDNVVLHYIMPVAMLADYIIDRPATVLLFKQCVLWLLFPLLYVIYSLIRGFYTEWYPYPFLNPTVGGYTKVFIVVLGISILGIVITYGLSKYTRHKT